MNRTPDGDAKLSSTLRPEQEQRSAPNPLPDNRTAYARVIERDRALVEGLAARLERNADHTNVEHDAFLWRMEAEALRALIAMQAPAVEGEAEPVKMILFCPACGVQHIDEPQYNAPSLNDPGSIVWDNPPHRSHLCQGCGHIWRPADVPTEGVQSIATKGKADSPIALPSTAVGGGQPVAWAVSPPGSPDDWRFVRSLTDRAGFEADGWTVRPLALAQPTPPSLGEENQELSPSREPALAASGRNAGAVGGWRCTRCDRDEIDAQANGCTRGPCPMVPR